MANSDLATVEPLHPLLAEGVKARQTRPAFPDIGPEAAKALFEAMQANTSGQPEVAGTEETTVAGAEGPLSARIYRPEASAEQPPLIVYLHGGGFVLFSIDTHDRLMREYADRAGIAVIGIDYPRAPEARFPQPLEACIDALRWLRANASTLGFDATQTFVGGDSAGANLAVGTALALRDAGDAPLAGLVLNYGAYSSNLYRDSMAQYGAGDYGLSAHMMIWFRGMYLARAADFQDPRYDLLRADTTGLPPVQLVITECDPLRDDSFAFQGKLEREGVNVTAKVYPGTAHSFLEAVSIADVAVAAFDDTARWIREVAATARQP